MAGKRLGVEIKRTDAPAMTKSMAQAREDLRLDGLAVVYPGEQRFPIANGVDAVPVGALAANGPHVLFPDLFAKPRAVRARRSKPRRT